MDQKRALYIMLFFAMLLSLIGVFAAISANRYYVQLNSLIHSDYVYSVTSRSPGSQDSYFQFNAGINYSVSPESAVSLNANILMQSKETLYTDSVDWNAQELNSSGVAISEGIAKAEGLKVGDEIFSKHIVDGEIHAYTIEQILPDIIFARVSPGRTYSDGLIIMGTDEKYVDNISYSFVSYTSTPIEALTQELAEVPENILYRSDEIMTMVKELAPYLVLFLLLSIVIAIIMVGLLAKEIKHNFRRLMTLGWAKNHLDAAYWKHICRNSIPPVLIAFGASLGASLLLSFNTVKAAVMLIIFFAEVVAILLSALLLNRRLWR